MKLLQIINSHGETVGGAERLSRQLHEGALEAGIDSHLLSLMKAPASRAHKTYSLHGGTPYHPGVVGRLIRFLRQPQWKDTDVIHVHLFPAQSEVALAAKLVGLRAKLVTTEHNTFNRRRTLPGAKGIDRLTYRQYERIACISEGTRDAMGEWLPELSPRLRVILNGIDLARFDASKRELATPNPLVVLCLGRLTEQKNPALALRVVAGMGADAPAFELWFAGQGEQEAALRAQAQALGIGNRVRFLGFRRDVPELLARADVFLSTAKWEGFGLSVVEAMASGLPVLVPDVPGVSEVVGRSSGAGILVASDDAPAYSRALERLLRDPQGRHSLGEAGRKRAALFDVRDMVRKYLALYEEVSPSRA